MPPSSVHFNGSVNLPDAETVMREISSRIPTGVRRMTDGETGERNYWIHFQIQKFLAMPELETVSSGQAYETDDQSAPAMPQLRLADGVSPDAVNWPDLGYADAYIESFQTFRALQEDGTIPADVRFQVQYPTPIAPLAGSIVPEDLPRLAMSYEAALLADLDKAIATIGHDRCAVQWDVAVEFGLLEDAFGPGTSPPLDEIAASLARCADHVPDDVPVGMHLCYGDYGHQHFKQPDSLDLQVRLVNAVLAAAHRTVNWFSFTVPQGRGDEDYFAPLRDLQAGQDTELYFALVPYYPDDQPPGTTAEQVRLDRRSARAVVLGVPRVGHLHRMRDGPGRVGRCSDAARPSPRASREHQLTTGVGLTVEEFEPAPALRGVVHRAADFHERGAAPLRRLESPLAGVVLIVSLGPDMEIDGRADGLVRRRGVGPAHGHRPLRRAGRLPALPRPDRSAPAAGRPGNRARQSAGPARRRAGARLRPSCKSASRTLRTPPNGTPSPSSSSAPVCPSNPRRRPRSTMP